jgi:hypothetical protein
MPPRGHDERICIVGQGAHLICGLRWGNRRRHHGTQDSVACRVETSLYGSANRSSSTKHSPGSVTRASTTADFSKRAH